MAALTALLALGAASPDNADGKSLRLVDDLGKPLSGTVEMCWTHELSTDCSERAADAPIRLLEPFDAVTVEGDLFGPVRRSRGALFEDGESSGVLIVPRKARLRLFNLGPELPDTVSVSFYASDSPDFRHPVWHRQTRLAQLAEPGLPVPAGDFVASLLVRSMAPDLHHLILAPGETVELDYQQPTGWSILLRVVSASTGGPVVEAKIRLEPTLGFGDPERESRSLQTDALGLAVASGIEATLLEGHVEHPEFQERMAVGLTASPGSFAFEEIRLPVGSRVQARVTQNGEPVAGAGCRLLPPFAPGNPLEDQPPPSILLGKTDENGVCQGVRLAEGAYVLEVVPSEEPHHAVWARPVSLLDGEESVVEVDLDPVRVVGEVLRGTEPATGYKVRFQQATSGPQAPSGLIEDIVDEDGRYQAVVWEEGLYDVLVRDLQGTIADSRRVLLGPAEETVSFRLAAEDITGIVVDEKGRPIPEAGVALRWPVEGGLSHRLAFSGDSGTFSFSIEDRSGPARLTAKKPGYGEASVEIEVEKGVPPDPVRLVLPGHTLVHGTVVDAAGQPMANLWVATSTVDSRGIASVLGAGRTDAAGRFELPRAADGTPQYVFMSGPACPLKATELLSRGSGTALVLRCPLAPAAIQILLHNQDGDPRPGQFLLVRQDRIVIPRNVLRAHQQMLGLPESTDGSGKLALVALAPGAYDLYLSGFTNTQAILLGRSEGHLATVSVAPLEAAEVEVRVDAQP